MPFCRSCGGQVPAEASFCGTCGEPLTLTLDTPTGSNTLLKTELTPARVEPTQPAQAPQIEPAAPRQRASSIEQEKQDQQEPLMPLPPVTQPPGSGHIPVAPGTPTNGIPTIHGIPQQASMPSLPGSAPAGNASSPYNPTQPGSAANASHATRPHNTAQPGNSVHAHASQQPSTQQFGSSSSAHASSSHAQAGNLKGLHRGRWGLRRPAQQSAAHSSAAGGAGTAAGSGAAVAVKAIVAIVIIAAAAAGAVKAAPVLFHRGSTQTGGQQAITTQPMPPTLTSCPAPGAARAMVSRTLAPGHHQDLVFSTGAELERYDTSAGRTTTILQARGGSLDEAQLSADGTWLLFENQVGNQNAIQAIRLDGQGLQTLHCAPAGQSIFGLSWSPDQQTLAFDEGSPFDGPHGPSGAANTELLQVKTGKLETALIQPVYVPNQDNQHGYLPFYWLDNTHLYMQDYIRCCVGDNPPIHLYVLNTGQGTNQHPGNLGQGTTISSGFIQQAALSPDRGTLLQTSCTCGFNLWRGPSPITEQPATGGGSRTIYTDSANAITNIAAIDANDLLVVISNTEGDLSQNGLWRLNLVTHQRVHLMPNHLNSQASFLFNLGTGSTWANIARDGSMYAVKMLTYASDGLHTTSSLFVGSLQGKGTAVNIYTGAPVSLQNTLPQPDAFIVGWTEM